MVNVNAREAHFFFSGVIANQMSDSAQTPINPTVSETVADTATVDTAADTITVDVPQTKSGKKERSFTIVKVLRDGEEQDGFTKGRFVSKNPAGAARKAASKIFRTLFGKDDDNCQIRIVIKETTKSSSRDEYPYTATRTLLGDDKRRSVTFKGPNAGEPKANNVGFKYDIKLKSERVSGKKKQNVEEGATSATPEAS